MGTSQIQRRMEELDKMRSDRVTCRVMEKMLQERYDKQRKNVEQSSGDTLELEFKLDEVARAEKVFELIAQRALQLQTERSAPARITLMQQAEPPDIPVEVFPYRHMAAVLLVCLCLPFALAVVWERMVGRVSDPMMLERQSKLSVVGEIAHLPVRSPVSHGSASARIKHDLRLFEESIDSLRTSLSLSAELTDMRILAITSAASREGKTSVVSQLAVSFARATGKKVLLIDGDMRCPDIHKVFDVDLEPGLAKVLSGECRLEDAIVTELERPGASVAGGSAGGQSAQAAWQRGLAVVAEADSFVLSPHSDRHAAGAVGQRGFGADQGGRRLVGVRDARRQPGRPTPQDSRSSGGGRKPPGGARAQRRSGERLFVSLGRLQLRSQLR